MSIKVMNLVWENGPEERNQFMVLLALADWADDNGRAYPGIEALSRKARCSVRTVQETVKKMRHFGTGGTAMLRVEPNAGPSGTNRYTINLAMLKAMGAARDEAKFSKPENDETGGADFAPPQKLHPAENDVQGVQNAYADCTRTIINHQNNPQSAQARERGDLPDDGKGKASDEQRRIKREFQALVNNWPGFKGLSLASAWREYLSMSLDDRSLAARKKDQWLRLLKSQGKDHVPAPSTYFRERLWEAVPDLQDVAAESRKLAAPFGKAWMHHVLMLLNQPAQESPPAPAFIRKVIEEGGEKAQRAIFERQAKYGWPEVNRIFENASSGQGSVIPAAIIDGMPEMEAVGKNSPDLADWRCAFEARGLPWMRFPEAVEFIWMPKGGPDAWLTKHPHPPLGPSQIPTPCGAGRPRHFASDGGSKADLTTLTTLTTT
jgi:hypothetical protein